MVEGRCTCNPPPKPFIDDNEMLNFDSIEKLDNSKSGSEIEIDRVRFMEYLVHDMRSLLAPIQGFAEIMASSTLDDESIDPQYLSEIIATQSFQLGKMIEDALVCTRILENKLELHLEPVPITPMLDSMLKETSAKSEKEILYSNHLGDSLIRGDLFYLRDAINRIIENAVQNSQTKILISASLDRQMAGSQILICVEDDGIGIAEVDIPALFMLFGRFQDRQSRGSFGNGMGLFIAKTIIDRHGGKIEVLSSPGTKTVFMLSLPMIAQ